MNTTPPVPLGAIARAALHSRLMDRVLRWRAADIMRKAELGRDLPASGLLLDLGAGLGHLTEAVLNGSRRCVAVDPVWSPPPPLATRLATQAGSDGAGWMRVVHADGTALPFAANSFDGGWCAFVLHHLPPARQRQVLAEAARVLRPGAPFILIEDTPAAPATLRADRRLNFEGPGAPHHYRDPSAWHDLLRDSFLPVVAEIPFTTVFPRVTWRPVPHRAFLCRVAAEKSRPATDAPPNPRPG